jgi:glycosyltransferase involved in cell wall biosynthesis
MRKIKIGWLAQWPVHYHLPIYKGLSRDPDVNLTVIFCDDITLKGYFEKDMNTVRTWDDLDMLEGYQSKFLKNYTTHNNDKELLTVLNPGIILEVLKGNYDVMVIGGYMGITYWLALLACKLTNTRTIFRGESTLHNIDRGNLVERIKKYYLKVFFKLIDAEFFSCTGNKEFLDFYSVGNTQVSLPCAVDNSYYQSKYREYLGFRSSLRHELGIADNEVVITTVGKLVERKNPLGIIRSVAECRIKNPVVLYIGDGPLKAAIQKEADANDVRVIFTGYKMTSEIAKYYSISDIYFQISIYDPSPKSLNEAMNFSLPLIVTSVIGTAIDLVSHGQNGFIVDHGDQSQLTNALDSLNTRERRETMGLKSADIVKGYSIELTVEQAIIASKALILRKVVE